MAAVVCAAPECQNPLPPNSHPNRKYCTPRCRTRVNERNWYRRRKAKQQFGEITEKIGDLPDKPINRDYDERWAKTAARRGAIYEKLLDPANRKTVLEPLLNGDLTFKAAGQLIDAEGSSVHRAMLAIREDIITDRAADEWQLTDDNRDLLGPPADQIPKVGTPEWDAFLDSLTAAFVQWRTRFMTDAKGNPYYTKGFHRTWIRSILASIFTGGRLMILSPPRHGKTQLLIDFCTWQICRDPNVRILWIAANGDLVADWIAAIEDQLENNEELRRAYLPPGLDWKPQSRTGKSWSRSQFTVGTRTVVGIGGATMQGIGRGGRILSRNVDFMIVDDIEDHGSTIQPGAREGTRKWFAQDTGSRKEEHTAVVVIGSRQHPDDLYGHLLDNPEWETIVEEAHSSICDLDPLDETVHIECMLFPELRTYQWLMGQKRSFDITGGEALFLMVYQNVAMAEGLMIFNPDELHKCRSSRGVGDIPPGCELVAGLDPAMAGYQASVLWAFQRSTGRYFLIDIDNSLGAGIPGWRDILAAWYAKYNLRHWVVEDTAAQRGYLQDQGVRDFQSKNHIHIEGHHTGHNKWDKFIGVTAMARLFEETVTVQNVNNGMKEEYRRVDLPYGTPSAKVITDLYTAQAVHFSQNASSNRNTRHGYKSDVVMASWFPMKAIRRWRKEYEAEIVFDYEPTFAALQRTDWNEPPWGRMSLG